MDFEYKVKDGFRQLLFVHVLIELEQIIHYYKTGLKMNTMKELVEIASYQWHISIKIIIFEILIKLGKQLIFLHQFFTLFLHQKFAFITPIFALFTPFLDHF